MVPCVYTFDNTVPRALHMQNQHPPPLPPTTTMSRRWFGPADEYLFGLTHIETFLMWHAFPRDDNMEAAEEIAHFRNPMEASGFQASLAFLATLLHSTCTPAISDRCAIDVL